MYKKLLFRTNHSKTMAIKGIVIRRSIRVMSSSGLQAELKDLYRSLKLLQVFTLWTLFLATRHGNAGNMIENVFNNYRSPQHSSAFLNPSP